VGGPALGEQLAVVADDLVLVAEPRAAHVAAPRVHVQDVVEPRRDAVAEVRLEHERLDPLFPERLIAASEGAEIFDGRDLEPDDVRGVVRDPLSVRVGEPDADRGGEREPFHRRNSTMAP
jgi:hypothetical protein